MNKPQYIVIHHSATPRDTTGIAGIDAGHKSRGFPRSSLGYYVGYHYVILGDGTIVQCRKEDEVGAHAKTTDGMNLKSIGVCLVGNFDEQTPNVEQLKSLAGLIAGIRARHITIPLDKVISHGEVAQTACAGKSLVSWVKTYRTPVKEKEHYQTKNTDSFVALVIVDDELLSSDIKLHLMETQKKIWEASRGRLVLDLKVVFRTLSVWDNLRVRQIAKEEFELSDYQAVVAIYKAGKFRTEGYAHMNPLDEQFGILINQSFEDPAGDPTQATVLAHEFCHAFMFYLNSRYGTVFDYIGEVHKTPDVFEDDLDLIKDHIPQLYYVNNQTPVDPLPAPVPPVVTPAPLPTHMPETSAVVPAIKPGYQTTEFWVTLLTTLTGLGTMLGYLTPGEIDVNAAANAIATVVGAVVALISLIGYLVSRTRVKTGK